jgi:hypothetical protein
MPILAWLASTRIGRYVAAAGIILAVLVAGWIKARSEGGAAARREAQEIDHAGAKEIRTRVDAALADDAADGRDAAARLREAGRLRD